MCRQCKCCEQSRDRRCVVGACSCCTKASAGAGDSELSRDMSADSTQATRDNPAMVQLARLSWTLSTGQVRSASAASAWLQVRRRPKRPKAKVRNTICPCHRQRRSTQAPRTATTPSWLQATTRPRAGHPCPAVPVPLPFTRFPRPLVPLDAVNHGHGGLPREKPGFLVLFCKKQNAQRHLRSARGMSMMRGAPRARLPCERAPRASFFATVLRLPCCR